MEPIKLQENTAGAGLQARACPCTASFALMLPKEKIQSRASACTACKFTLFHPAFPQVYTPDLKFTRPKAAVSQSYHCQWRWRPPNLSSVNSNRRKSCSHHYWMHITGLHLHGRSIGLRMNDATAGRRPYYDPLVNFCGTQTEAMAMKPVSPPLLLIGEPGALSVATTTTNLLPVGRAGS